MKKLIVLLLVVAPLVFAYQKKPQLYQHEAKIYALTMGPTADINPELYDLAPWENLEFKDWLIASATRDQARKTLVSFGIGRYIKVVDREWGAHAFGLKSGEDKN